MSTPGRITLKDLANELGLSVSVVSRVLNGKAGEYRISEQTQAMVQEAAERLGFTVNQLARGLRLKQTHTIGLLIPDISNSFFSLIARTVEITVRNHGYAIILCDTEDDGHVEQQALSLLINRSVDGLLVAPVGQNAEHIREIDNQGVPVVLVDRFFEGLDIPYVTSDNRQGAYHATNYLLDRGHRRIGYIQGIPDSKPNIERLRGYRQALQDRGLEPLSALIRGSKFDEVDGLESTRALLADGTVTALFASSSLGALGAMRACSLMNRSIPDDVSLIGFDDYPFAPLLAPPLTTVAQQTEVMAARASELLVAWIESGERPENSRHMLETRLIARDSVAVGGLLREGSIN